MTLGSWSDAAYGDQSAEGNCRLRCVIGLMLSTLPGPRHILQWNSKFATKSARSIRGGDVHAFSELINHTSPLCEFYGPFVNLSPGVTRFEGCEGLVARLMNKQATTGGYSTRHFPGIQQLLETAELGDVYRLSGLENPTDGVE